MKKVILLTVFLLLVGCTEPLIENTPPEQGPQQALADECSFTEAFECVSYKVSPDSVRLVLKNKLNREINNIEIGLERCDIVKKGGSLVPEQQAIYDIDCRTGGIGEQYNVAVVVNYETDVKHSTLGKLNAVVK